MTTRRSAALLLLVLLAACGGGRARVGGGEQTACMRLQAEREVRGVTLCEDVWTCFRPPNGLVDRIGLRRLALCDQTTGPIVLYLPGMFMNAEFLGNDARHDLRLYLAASGIRTWSLDYRTHSVPADAAPEQLQAVGRWTADTFRDDAAWAAGFVRGADPGPLYLAGFSYGASVAYALAARGDQALAGLVILDGVPGGFRPGSSEGPVMDAGSSRLPWPERERLLQAVIQNPRNVSAVPGAGTAGATLADILWTSAAFGGNGGLSAARDGVSDIQVVARLLATYDRWWPRAAFDGATPKPGRPVPVLAFAGANMGPQWVESVRSGAKAFGADRAAVRELPLHGHLDVLVGRLASEEVFEPVRRWMNGAR